MKVGIVTYQIGAEWDLPMLIEKCEAAGIEGVEPRTTHAHAVELELSSAERAEVKKRFDDSSVKLAGLGSVCEYDAIDPEEVKQNIEATREWVKLAADLGCPGVKVRPNKDHQADGVPLERTLEQIGLALRECGEFGRDYGVEIRLEVHGRVTCEPKNCKTILDVCDHSNVYACWNCNPQADIVNGSIADNLNLLKDRIGLVHTRDLIVDYPWLELAEGLLSVGYEGYVLAEIPASPDPERVMSYYRALWLAYWDLAKSRRV